MYPDNLNSGFFSVFFCLRQHAGRNIDAGHLITAARQFDRMPTRATAHVKYSGTGCKLQFLDHKVNFSNRVAGKNLALINRSDDVKKLLPVISLSRLRVWGQVRLLQLVAAVLFCRHLSALPV